MPTSRRLQSARPGIAAATALLLICASSTAALADGPGWYKRKKQVEKEKVEEEATKQAEKPVVGSEANGKGENAGAGPAQEPVASQLSPVEDRKIETNLLFKGKGATDMISVDFGSLQQDEVSGATFSAQLAFGWWWRPDLVLSGFLRPGAIFTPDYIYFMALVGPQLRYYWSKHWMLTGNLAFGYTQGLTRTSTAHLPLPSNDVLRARTGPLVGAQVTYLFWPKRDLGIGPSLSYWRGKQDERSLGWLTVGITLQGGRPNYTGDLTSW